MCGVWLFDLSTYWFFTWCSCWLASNKLLFVTYIPPPSLSLYIMESLHTKRILTQILSILFLCCIYSLHRNTHNDPGLDVHNHICWCSVGWVYLYLRYKLFYLTYIIVRLTIHYAGRIMQETITLICIQTWMYLYTQVVVLLHLFWPTAHIWTVLLSVVTLPQSIFCWLHWQLTAYIWTVLLSAVTLP